MAYIVTFSSPGAVGVKQAITLTWDSESLGGVAFTVTSGDSGAGGAFDEAGLGGNDSDPTPPLVFHYTPAAAGTVTFDFTCDNGDVTFNYTPATLTVNAAATRSPSASMSLGLGSRGGGMGLGIS